MDFSQSISAYSGQVRGDQYWGVVGKTFYKPKYSLINNQAMESNAIVAVTAEFKSLCQRATDLVETNAIRTVTIPSGNAQLKVPVYVLKDVSEITTIENALGEMAKLGILAHINSNFYQTLKSTVGRIQARMKIRPLTAHNGKLGFNWSVLDKKYVAAPSTKQFSVSSYPGLMIQASQFHSSIGNNAYAKYLQDRTNSFDAPIMQNADAMKLEGYGDAEQRMVRGFGNALLHSDGLDFANMDDMDK